MTSSTSKNQDIDRGERIRLEREQIGLNIVDFAVKSGVSKGSQRLYEKGSAPTADYLVAIGNLGVDIVYVLTGRRAQDIEPRIGTSVRRMDGTVIATYKGKPPADEGNLPLISETDRDDFIRLPMYQDVHASAGPGVIPIAEHANDAVAFGRRFLRDQGAVPERCSIIWARGTSMEPTIPDGSILVVDHSQSTVEHGCIYVFNVSDRLLVKRARWRMDGKLDLVSDNTNEIHPIETFAPDTVEQLRVVGRLVYFCRQP